METPSQRRSGRGDGETPARITRLQEKEDLMNLNDRLAAYIDKVRSLEAENAGLRLRITESESSVSRDLSGIKTRYQAELTEARKNQDQVAKERARLQLELGETREEQKELKARLILKESELEAALVRLRDLETLLNNKDLNLNAALGEKKRLEAEEKELKVQLGKLDGVLSDTKKQLQDEMLRRVDAENRLQTLKEELDFQRNIHTEELNEARCRFEARVQEVDVGRRQEFENQLAEALTDLRDEHKETIRLYKEETEKYYNCKLKEARQSEERKNFSLRATTEELKETQREKENMSAQILQLQRQLTSSEAKVQDLEDVLTRERNLTRSRLQDKDEETSEMRGRMQQQLDDYKELMDMKLALDMEINAYRKLLEREEERLHLSPSPRSQHGVRTPLSGRSAASSSSKKRRLAFSDDQPSGGTVTETRISQHASAGAHFSFTMIDPEGRFIRLSNKSDEDQSLGSWQLKRQVGSSSPIVYTFPPNFILKAGATVTVWAASGGGTHNPPSDLVWKNQDSWGSGDLLETTLISANGEEKTKKRDVTRTLFQGEDEDENLAAPGTHGAEVEYNLRSRMVLRDAAEVEHSDGGDSD